MSKIRGDREKNLILRKGGTAWLCSKENRKLKKGVRHYTGEKWRRQIWKDRDFEKEMPQEPSNHRSREDKHSNLGGEVEYSPGEEEGHKKK